jgi:hypothetical protein
VFCAHTAAVVVVAVVDDVGSRANPYAKKHPNQKILSEQKKSLASFFF